MCSSICRGNWLMVCSSIPYPMQHAWLWHRGVWHIVGIYPQPTLVKNELLLMHAVVTLLFSFEKFFILVETKIMNKLTKSGERNSEITYNFLLQ